VLANLQISGRTWVVQSGRRAELRRGDLVFYDASLEYEIIAESNFRTLVFQAPRRTFSERCHEIHSVVGHRLDGTSGLARPILRFLSAVPNASEDAGTSRALLEQYSVDLLRTAMNLVAPKQKRPSSAQTEAYLLRAKQIVEERLSDSEFNRDQLAAQLGISVRGLSRLFSDEKLGPSDYIRVRRLEHCRRALLDPNSTTRTITEIAFCYGFNDSAHFSSAFREVYGKSPREYRKHP
jgi:AraC-like DNA-binding protein